MTDLGYNSAAMEMNPFYKMRAGAEEFPLMVHIEITYVCNSKCPHCPYTESNSDIRRFNWDKGNRHISVGLFQKVADEVGSHGRFLRITGGGEPMMHPECVNLIEYAKKVGCSVGLITNGSLITPPVADALLDVGLDVIEFSVDAADHKTYKKVRAGLDWNQLMRNMEYILSRRNSENLKTRIITSVINQKSVMDKIEAIEAFWKQRVDHVVIRKFLSWGMVNRKLSGDDIPFLNVDTPCPYPYERCIITQEGKLVLCGYDIEGANAVGNISETTIKAIWNSVEYKKLREAMWLKHYDEIPFCRDCQDRIYRSWDHNYLKTLELSDSGREVNIHSHVCGKDSKD
ncbi:radical SAM/SPASM domain-containing protein [Candidatus Magnetominusculus xianensis]|uniref:Radical SAM protein n=1 Tax=Candidatus Magnetominusculus xianensis TaxID=1748249 RepID=A0ABR5SBY5_9BACT|nr:radical SAM protein [Candidatus Magnetominusculus xianensis]KWT78358.1 radical SAM protein [Candidatus Magnetominusculus xianensis]MBF0402896.1 radical SAM protein [Nitrospirota bacterium]